MNKQLPFVNTKYLNVKAARVGVECLNACSNISVNNCESQVN